MYWKKHFHEVAKKLEPPSASPRSSPPSPPSSPSSPSSLTPSVPSGDHQALFNLIGRLPVVMVTKLEVSDFVADFEVDKQELSQGKGPFASLVVVGGIIKLTRSVEIFTGFLQLKNSYIHMSGLGHTPRPDDPEVLPLSSHHVWGRVVSIGSGTLITNGNFSLAEDNEGEELSSNVSISGNCVSMVTEVSDVTLSTLFQLMSHFKRRYFPPLPPPPPPSTPLSSELGDTKTDQTSLTTPDEIEATGSTSSNKTGLASLASLVDSFSFTIDGFNGLIYEDRESPSPPLFICLRIDSLSLKDWSIDYYRVAIDELYSLPPYYQCLSACNLPNGGLLDIDHCSLSYEQVSD